MAEEDSNVGFGDELEDQNSVLSGGSELFTIRLTPSVTNLQFQFYKIIQKQNNNNTKPEQFSPFKLIKITQQLWKEGLIVLPEGNMLCLIYPLDKSDELNDKLIKLCKTDHHLDLEEVEEPSSQYLGDKIPLILLSQLFSQLLDLKMSSNGWLKVLSRELFYLKTELNSEKRTADMIECTAKVVKDSVELSIKSGVAQISPAKTIFDSTLPCLVLPHLTPGKIVAKITELSPVQKKVTETSPEFWKVMYDYKLPEDIEYFEVKEKNEKVTLVVPTVCTLALNGLVERPALTKVRKTDVMEDFLCIVRQITLLGENFFEVDSLEPVELEVTFQTGSQLHTEELVRKKSKTEKD